MFKVKGLMRHTDRMIATDRALAEKLGRQIDRTRRRSQSWPVISNPAAERLRKLASELRWPTERWWAEVMFTLPPLLLAAAIIVITAVIFWE